MIEFLQLVSFLIIFYFLYQKDKRDREQNSHIVETFYNAIKKLSDNTDKFMEMTKEMQIEHFASLEKHSAKQLTLLSTQSKQFMESLSKILKKSDPIVERISVLDEMPKIENTIEKEDIPGAPLSEMPPFEIGDVKNVQFEGEEEILPI